MFKKNTGLLNKDSKKKFLLIIGLSVLFIGVGIILIATNSLSGLMGDSVTEYYCEDSSYNLEGSKCVKQLREKSILLGDLDGDDKVTEADLKVMEEYINRFYEEEDPQFTDEQILAADISKDDEIFDNDLTLLKEYFGGNGSMGNVYSDTIGVERNCKVGYTLNGTWCIKKDIVNAKVKERVENNKESNTVNKNNNIDNNKQQNTDSSDNKIENESALVDIEISDDVKQQVLNKSEKYNEAYTNDYESKVGIYGIKKVTINAVFSINNASNYYYKWLTYRYGTLSYESECLKFQSGKVNPTLDMSLGKRKGKFVVYNDSKCTEIIYTKETKEYSNAPFYEPVKSFFEISSAPVKAITKNIQNGKEYDNEDIIDSDYVPNDTRITFKINFKIYNKEKKYYYTWASVNSFSNLSDIQTSECKTIPESGVLYNDIYVKYKDGTTYSMWEKYFGILRVYDEPNCSRNLIETYKTKLYNKQYFIVNYDTNGGTIQNKEKSLSVKKLYNYKNKTDLTTRVYSATTIIHKGGYDLIGYRVKNSKGKFVCYKNLDKTSQGFTSESDCKKYGYVIYKNSDILSRTTSINGENLTFIAQWTNNPVTVHVAKYGNTKLGYGTTVNIPITFTVNDTENTYYYRWFYNKYDHVGDYYYSPSKFLDRFLGLSVIDHYYYGEPDVQNNGGKGFSTIPGWKNMSDCWKITNTEFFNPTLTVEKALNVGVIVVYRDSECKHMVGSEKNVHKTTEVFQCANVNGSYECMP